LPFLIPGADLEIRKIQESGENELPSLLIVMLIFILEYRISRRVEVQESNSSP